MDIPKITLPAASSMAPNLSLQNTIKNIGSSSGGVSIPSVSAPNLGGLGSQASSALGGLSGNASSALGSLSGGATSLGSKATDALGGLGGGADTISSGMQNLQGAARAKFMASVPSLPDPGPGMKGLMEKGVDLGKFQEKSVGNLMSKVSDFSPGKSIIELSKEADGVNALKDKLSSLKPSLPNIPSVPGVPSGLGAVAQQALAGGAVGAVVGAVAGGKDKLGGALKGAAIGAAVSGIGGAISSSTGGITSKIGSALGGGGVANAVTNGVAGAVGGAALAKLTGQSVNLKSVAGNLAGSVGGGLGAQLGAKLTGANIPGASGIGAAAGGLISGMVGGSAGKKALVGLAAGTGVTALTGVLTKNISAPTVGGGSQALNQQVSQTTNQLQAQTIGSGPIQPISGPSNALTAVSPSNVISTTPPDLSKNAPLEVQSLADKSPQSVPSINPTIPPDSSSGPSKLQMEAIGSNGLVTDSNANLLEKKEGYEEVTITDQAKVSTFLKGRGDFITDMSRVITSKYSGFFSDDNWSSMVSKMSNDIKKVTEADKNRVKQVIQNYNGAFSIGFSGAVKDPNGVSDPNNRMLSFNDYLALDTENFYKFITNVAEGSHTVAPLTTRENSNETPYKIFISQKSESEVLLTVSHPAFGTATATIPRIVPPPLETLFDAKGVFDCAFKYHYAATNPNRDKWNGTLDTLNGNGGSLFRMFAQFGKIKRYCCGDDIVIGDMNCGKAVENKPYGWENQSPLPWPWGSVGKLKITDTSYFWVTYHAYTINISNIEVYKLVPKK